MKVENLIDKLKYLPKDANAVIVLPKEAVPLKEWPFQSVAYDIKRIYISREDGLDIEIGISI